MWKLMPFMGKEPVGLEGRTVHVGNMRVHVHNAIAEGGFSCVYLARDVVHGSKQYALKHMICNDSESLDLVMKEISVMKLLKGHPNVVTLVAHTILDMGRTNEAILVMEFCEKSLVSVLENRGAGYFDEKQVLLIFRDVCNAVFAMHNQSPPIAHRDLKVENLLLGSDGTWKLCDFGSISTNHKCFDRPEEMGLEEDNIRKHTTPAYRAPEMWDLLRKEVISEKVDIWALGCLLYRICYLKSAFDGESKLQILNGNYRIPELPKYSTSIKGLIKDMLEASPNARPDITQVWFRVNELLPVELQKRLPDGAASTVAAHSPSNSFDEGGPRRTLMMPRRSTPPPPSPKEQVRNLSPLPEKAGGSPMGAFWSTQHALDSEVIELEGPLFDEPVKLTVKPIQNSPGSKASPANAQHVRLGQQPRSAHGNPIKKIDDAFAEDFDIRSSSQYGSQKTQAPNPESKSTSQNKPFNAFVTDFDTGKFNSGNSTSNASRISGRREHEAEVDRLKEQLKQTNLDKAEITSKYEKLTAICRSQRQEIQELKRALATATPSPQSKDGAERNNLSGSMQSGTPSGTPQRKKIEGTVWELEQGLFASCSTSPGPEEPKPWQAFSEEPRAQPASKNNHARPSGKTNGNQNTLKQPSAGPSNTFDFGLGLFTTASAGSQIHRTSAQENTSQRFSIGGAKKIETGQPAGWAGF